MTSDDAFMALAGVRYCLGRHSYAPGLCCDWLRRKWSSFDERDRVQIMREIKSEIATAEGRGDRGEPLYAIDLRTWESFVAWAEAPASRAALQKEGRDAT